MQPNSNRLKYFAIFKNVVHSLELCETPSYSASHQASNYVQRSRKNGEITTTFQFTGTAAQPHRNRKLIQSGYAQYFIAFTVLS